MMKYLRVAVALLPVLSLWTSSHLWYGKMWFGTRHNGIIAESRRGDFQLRWDSNSDGYVIAPSVGIRFKPAGPYANNYDARQWHCAGFGIGWNTQDELYPQLRQSIIGCPYWFLAVIAGTLAAIPWSKCRYRFSLRALLVAMTLVAVVLGIIVIAF